MLYTLSCNHDWAKQADWFDVGNRELRHWYDWYLGQTRVRQTRVKPDWWPNDYKQAEGIIADPTVAASLIGWGGEFDQIHPDLLANREWVKQMLLNSDSCGVMDHVAPHLLWDLELIAIAILNENNLSRIPLPVTELDQFKQLVKTYSQDYLPWYYVNGYYRAVSLETDRSPEEFETWDYSSPDTILNAFPEDAYWAFCFAPVEIKTNRQLVKHATKIGGAALAHSHWQFWSDLELVTLAAETWGNILQFADPAIRHDHRLLCTAIKNDIFAFNHIDKSVLNDKQLVVDLINVQPEIKDWISKSTESDFLKVPMLYTQIRMLLEQYPETPVANDIAVLIWGHRVTGKTPPLPSDPFLREIRYQDWTAMQLETLLLTAEAQQKWFTRGAVTEPFPYQNVRELAEYTPEYHDEVIVPSWNQIRDWQRQAGLPTPSDTAVNRWE